MEADEELREAEKRMREKEPSRGLQQQVPPDEELNWVARQDLRTAWFSLILHKLKVMVIMLVFGVVAAVTATAAMESGLWGILAFLVVGIGAPAGYIGYQYYYLKNTTIEYGATDEQFIKYEETPTTTKTESLRVNRAKSAKYRQDKWDKMLDTGNISIRGVGRAGNLFIKNVRDSEAVHRMAQQQIAETEQVDDVGSMQQERLQRQAGR